MLDLLQHWQLITRPFEATWDTRFFFRSTSHQEALDRLAYVVQEGGMNIGMLTGEIGCGKTLTRAVLQASLPAQEYQVIALENSGFAFEDLLGSLLRRLGPKDIEVPSGQLARLDLLESLLIQHAADHRQVVVMLDEAQDMTMQTLHELRWLTNLNGAGQNLITLLLIGQPNLRPMVQSCADVDQRVGLRYHLQPLSLEVLPEYLAHRLHIAGHPNGLLFDGSAVQKLHELTRGVPRTVNRLAKLALEYGWTKDAHEITGSHVNAVAQDIALHQAVPLAA